MKNLKGLLNMLKRFKKEVETQLLKKEVETQLQQKVVKLQHNVMKLKLNDLIKEKVYFDTDSKFPKLNTSQYLYKLDVKLY